MQQLKFILILLLGMGFGACRTSVPEIEESPSMVLYTVPTQVGLGLLEFSFEDFYPLYQSEDDNLAADTLSFRMDSCGVWYFETRNLKGRLRTAKLFGGDSYEEGQRNIAYGLVRFPPEFAMRVIENTPSYYRLVLNEETFETVILKKDLAWDRPPVYVEEDPLYTLVNPFFQRDDYYELFPEYRDCYKDKRRLLTSFVELPTMIQKGYVVFYSWEELYKRAEYIWTDSMTLIYDKPEGNIVYTAHRESFKVLEMQGDWIKVNPDTEEWQKKKRIGWTLWKNEKEMFFSIVEHAYY